MNNIMKNFYGGLVSNINVEPFETIQDLKINIGGKIHFTQMSFHWHRVTFDLTVDGETYPFIYEYCLDMTHGNMEFNMNFIPNLYKAKDEQQRLVIMSSYKINDRYFASNFFFSYRRLDDILKTYPNGIVCEHILSV